jgi:hypothetical protein
MPFCPTKGHILTFCRFTVKLALKCTDTVVIDNRECVECQIAIALLE